MFDVIAHIYLKICFQTKMECYAIPLQQYIMAHFCSPCPFHASFCISLFILHPIWFSFLVWLDVWRHKAQPKANQGRQKEAWKGGSTMCHNINCCPDLNFHFRETCKIQGGVLKNIEKFSMGKFNKGGSCKLQVSFMWNLKCCSSLLQAT